MKARMLLMSIFMVMGLYVGSVSAHGCSCPHDLQETKNSTTRSRSIGMQQKVEKKVLSNGMTVLVHRVPTTPKVSLQLWYHVGSKDEKTGEKGIAHLIEHMIFKGTAGKDSLNISESDINFITHTLSGSCNAFTAQDFTGYLFNLPSHHWKQILPVIADTMVNTSFKDDHLSSEMKAVIQELKMRRDNYIASLAEEMMSAIFVDHPYHYPIIGFKQDLWSVHGDDLRKFYKKHYAPNNATLVVVGDVTVDDVFAEAEKSFGHIPALENYEKEEFFFKRDIVSKTVTLYRDIKQPFVTLAYVMPGVSRGTDHTAEIASWLLGSGKGSRLQQKIVDELQLATSLSTFSWNMFDYGLFFVAFEPKDLNDVEIIAQHIQQEIDQLAADGPSEKELSRAVKKSRMGYFAKLESTQRQANDIGKYFVATGDENHIFKNMQEPDYAQLSADVQKLLADNMRASVAHRGYVLPLAESEKEYWTKMQQESDMQDQRILSEHVRTSEIEPPSYLKNIKIKEQVAFDFPKPQTFELSNGVKVLWYDNPATPKVNIVIDLKSRHYFDPENLQGLSSFTHAMLLEGTKKYTSAQLADELESRGMAFSAYPGGVSMTMLSEDFEKGIELLEEILSNAIFAPEEVEKVRQQMLAEVKNFWDDPSHFAGQLIRNQVYKGHPYSKNSVGTKESIAAITRDDLVNFYEKHISPYRAKIAVVGDLKKHNVRDVLEKKLASWQGPEIQELVFPKLSETQSVVIDHPINRDQVTLCYAGLSVDRKDPAYDKLVLFDQIFGGGVLGSMSSRLFAIREQSGLFYSINGSLTVQANEQPGMVAIKTLVSLDRLAEAELLISNTIDTIVDTITEHELAQARNAILNAQVLNFESNASIAGAFLFLERYGFAPDYFDTRGKRLAAISLDEVKQAAKAILNTDRVMTLRIGRMNKSA